MPQINISFVSKKKDNEIWEWIDKNLQKTLERKIGIERIETFPDKNAGRIDFKGRTIKGVLTVKNSIIDILIEIPLLYRFFTPHIKSAVTKIFDQI